MTRILPHPHTRRPTRGLWFVSLLPALLAVLAGCDAGGGGLRVVDRYVDLSAPDENGMGHFSGAITASASAPEIREVSIHGDRRQSVVLGTPSRLVLRAAAGATRFCFGLAVRPLGSELLVQVRVDGELAHEEQWEDERGWVERSVELGGPSKHARTIEVELHGEGATVMLGHPQTLAPRGTEGDARPNVILYVVDCLRADHVGAYGYPRPTTPNLDALAEDSVLLTSLTSCAPWTKPSTGCLFTALLPPAHRARTVDDALPLEHTTLAEVLHAEGFQTLAWVANPVLEPGLFRFNQGFDRWVDVRSYAERQTTGSNVNSLDPDAAEITEAVLPWLEAHRDEEFFLYLHSLDLHYEYRPRAPFAETLVSEESTGLDRDRELYDSELAYNDHEIGKLIAALKRLGLYDGTLLVVTSDHGEEFGEHGSSRHGKTLYQPLLHIPGIVKLPGSRPSGRRLAALASNVDLAPTVLDVVGVRAPRSMRGRSLLPALGGTDKEVRDLAYAELVAPRTVTYAVRGERYKYIEQLAPETAERLFDLSTDPGETVDLLPDVPEPARLLLPALDQFLMGGQHGYHVSLGGPEGARVQARLSVRGTFRQAFRFGIETGDVMELGPDRERVTLGFVGGGTRRHLVLQTDPPDARLTISVAVDGTPVPAAEVRLGFPETRAASQTIDRESASVDPRDVEALLALDDAPVRVWYVALEAGGNAVELHDQALQDLRALGYLE
jgi:arylsulfatase A-like enzyme